MSPRKKGLVKFLLKLAVGGGLVAWLVAAKKLDPAQVWAARERWTWLLAAVALLLTMPLIGAVRWRWLLGAQGIRVPYGRALGLTWIGLLFNCFSVGLTGGDVVKAYLAAMDQPRGRRTEAVTSIVVDRVVGVTALLLVATAAVLANPGFAFRDVQMRVCAWGIVLAPPVLAVAWLLAFSRRVSEDPALRARVERWPGGRAVVRVYRALKVYRRTPGVLARCLAISVAGHAINIFALYFLARSLGLDAHPLGRYFLVVPIGLAASAVGLPLGLGVGQMVFAWLFVQMGGAVNDGANFATLYQFVILAISLTGLVPYLAHRREVREAGAEAEADAGTAAAGGAPDA